MKRYFKISPFYNGTGWYDTLSGILFNNKDQEYEIDSNCNSRKIDSYVIKNLLIETTHLHDAESEEAKRNREILKESYSNPASANHLLREERYNMITEKEDVIVEKEEVKVEETKEESLEEVEVKEESTEKEIENENNEEKDVAPKKANTKSSSNKKKKK